MNNRQVAKLLRAVAAAYEVKGKNRFKVIAYERAATAIEHATSEIKDLWDNNQLLTIPGVGKNIAKHLDELFKKGKVAYFTKVMKNLPPAMFTLLEIPGIGAKTAIKLCRELKIKSEKKALVKLKKAAQQGKIASIEGFGEESEKDILENIARLGRREDRMLLPFAWELAQKVIDFLKKAGVEGKIEALGSLRRMVATIGDIDLALATNQPQKAIKKFIKFPQAKQVLASGSNTARIILLNNRQVDLKTVKPEAFGALLQHFTGSKQHNIHLREIALKKGWSLSEYGIKKGKKAQAYSTEEEFYRDLGMAWIPPELREDKGEIEAAQKNKLPKLIKITAIKGDLHTHSNFPIEESHDAGTDPMKVMIQAATKLNYEYLGFSEHNPSLSQHSEKQIIDLIKRKKEAIEKINYSGIKKLPEKPLKRVFKGVFNGLEVDIRPNGDLALPAKALDLLDYAVASIHTSFDLSKEKMTQRVLKGLEHPKVRIFGHPTGRKLGQREGYELDWEAIFSFCQKNDKWLEINAFPERLDLPDSLVREAVKRGVKIIINSDAHSLDQLSLIFYGVSVARRGWAEKKNIVNTLPYDKITQAFKQK